MSHRSVRSLGLFPTFFPCGVFSSNKKGQSIQVAKIKARLEKAPQETSREVRLLQSSPLLLMERILIVERLLGALLPSADLNARLAV